MIKTRFLIYWSNQLKWRICFETFSLMKEEMVLTKLLLRDDLQITTPRICYYLVVILTIPEIRWFHYKIVQVAGPEYLEQVLMTVIGSSFKFNTLC